MARVKQYLPTAITLLRPALACVFVALLPGRFRGDIGPAVPLLLFVAICLSDFLDGRIARVLGMVSETGAYLDLYSDFFYITASLVTLNLLKRAPAWFTAVVLVKFIEYLITSRILLRGGCGFVPNPLGRMAAGLFFLMPGILCALYGINGYQAVSGWVLMAAACVAIVSSLNRCAQCLRYAKQRARAGAEADIRLYAPVSEKEMRYYL